MIKYRSWKENFAFAFCKIVFCVLKHLQRSRWYRRSQFVILFRQYFISMKVLRAFKGNNLVSILQPQWLAHLKTSPRHTKYWQECLLKSSSCGTLLQRGHFKKPEDLCSNPAIRYFNYTGMKRGEKRNRGRDSMSLYVPSHMTVFNCFFCAVYLATLC